MKAKALFITLLLSLSAVSLWAQEQYEYAYISYDTYVGKLSISIDGKEYSEETDELNKVVNKVENTHMNTNPLFNKIHAMEGKGWEVVNLSSVSHGAGIAVGFIHYAYLRKKKN